MFFDFPLKKMEECQNFTELRAAQPGHWGHAPDARQLQQL